jgi:hypothetical protein
MPQRLQIGNRQGWLQAHAQQLDLDLQRRPLVEVLGVGIQQRAGEAGVGLLYLLVGGDEFVEHALDLTVDHSAGLRLTQRIEQAQDLADRTCVERIRISCTSHRNISLPVHHVHVHRTQASVARVISHIMDMSCIVCNIKRMNAFLFLLAIYWPPVGTALQWPARTCASLFLFAIIRRPRSVHDLTLELRYLIYPDNDKPDAGHSKSTNLTSDEYSP